jgi:hypothetical protein
MHTLPLTMSEKLEQLNFESFAIAFNIMVSLAFVSSFGLVYIVMEKETEVKAMQYLWPRSGQNLIGIYYFGRICM